MTTSQITQNSVDLLAALHPTMSQNKLLKDCFFKMDFKPASARKGLPNFGRKNVTEHEETAYK